MLLLVVEVVGESDGGGDNAFCNTVGLRWWWFWLEIADVQMQDMTVEGVETRDFQGERKKA